MTANIGFEVRARPARAGQVNVESFKASRALHYVVSRRRISTYMGGVADKKIEQTRAFDGAGPLPHRGTNRSN